MVEGIAILIIRIIEVSINVVALEILLRKRVSKTTLLFLVYEPPTGCWYCWELLHRFTLHRSFIHYGKLRFYNIGSSSWWRGLLP
jgi:hypothetical protein